MNHFLPPVRIDAVYDHWPLAEQPGEFLTKRGDFEKLQELCGYGKGVKVGIGDTGVDKTHLEGDLSGVVDAKDFTRSNYGYYDRHSHGSHTTGHILARRDNAGMRGLAPLAEGYHFKCLGDSGSGSTTGIANGIRWAVDKGCVIINLSLGGSYSSEIEGACREAAEQGVLINASMGNSGTRGDGHPGNSRYTHGITAVDFNRRIADFSSRSQMAKYCGYGVQVLSCGLNGQYVRMSGTSMSSPDHTGICTLIRSYIDMNGLVAPRSLEEWETILAPGVVDLGTPGWDREYGIGFIDIWKVLESLKPPTPPEPFIGVATTESGKVFGLGYGTDGTVEIKAGSSRFVGGITQHL